MQADVDQVLVVLVGRFNLAEQLCRLGFVADGAEIHPAFANLTLVEQR
jgi:hypothetical protein